MRTVSCLLSICCFVFFYIYNVKGCGCYGPASCNTQSIISFCTIEGVCDCCPVCNTCNQLFGGCASLSTNYDAYFSPNLPSTFNFNENIGQYFVESSSDNYLWYPPCIQPALPNGLSMNISEEGLLYLTGIPSEILPPTVFTIKAKADAEVITALTFTLSITDTQGSNCVNTNTNQVCIYRSMRCLTDKIYQTCNVFQNGTTYWDREQNCRSGTTCTPDETYIYCL